MYFQVTSRLYYPCSFFSAACLLPFTISKMRAFFWSNERYILSWWDLTSGKISVFTSGMLLCQHFQIWASWQLVILCCCATLSYPVQCQQGFINQSAACAQTASICTAWHIELWHSFFGVLGITLPHVTFEQHSEFLNGRSETVHALCNIYGCTHDEGTRTLGESLLCLGLCKNKFHPKK